MLRLRLSVSMRLFWVASSSAIYHDLAGELIAASGYFNYVIPIRAIWAASFLRLIGGGWAVQIGLLYGCLTLGSTKQQL